MSASLYDLPPEILYSIAELVQSSPSDPRTIRACASSCSTLRAIFRPLAWNSLEISESYAGSGLRGHVSKGKQRAVERDVEEEGERGPGRGSGQSGKEGAGGIKLHGSSDALCAATDPPFIRALATLDDILSTSPEIATYVKDLEVYLPNEDGFGFSTPAEKAGEGAEEARKAYSGEWSERGWEAVWEERLFPRIAARLVNLRKLRVSVGSYHRQRRCPPRFRVDWDVLSPGLRSGFTTLFRAEKLEEVVFMGVVVPPRMLFGIGIGPSTTDRAAFGRLRKLELVAQCPISMQRLEEVDEFSMRRSISSSGSIASFLEDVPNAFQATSPLRYSFPMTTPPHTLTSLHLGFCDSEFLQYISTLYPAAFTGLKSLSLNIIERDLVWCQGFLDGLAGVPRSTDSGDLPTIITSAGKGGHSLESFDCTIRCNTPSSHHGLLNFHGLDFSRCTSLKHLTLKYLLLSQVTEVVKRAMEINLATALSYCRVGTDELQERDCVGGGLQRKGVETMHLVVDWAFNGDAILLEAFKDLDKTVEDAYYTSHGGAYGKGRRMKALNLESFKIEATHWPCPDAGNCGFRREVAITSPAPMVRSPSAFGSLSAPSTSSAAPPSVALLKRPTPLRTSSSPHPYRNIAAQSRSSNEGTLAKFFPFLTSQRGIEDGVEFESRYVLEHRRELGVMV